LSTLTLGVVPQALRFKSRAQGEVAMETRCKAGNTKAMDRLAETERRLTALFGPAALAAGERTEMTMEAFQAAIGPEAREVAGHLQALGLAETVVVEVRRAYDWYDVEERVRLRPEAFVALSGMAAMATTGGVAS
jgi:hypothetical protein